MPATSVAALEADSLIRDLAKPAPAALAFTEVRFSPLLRAPLIVRGELGYQGPENFDRQVHEPWREQARIRAGSVHVQRDDGASRSFALHRAPELEGLLAGFSALLAGDPAAVRQRFSMVAHEVDGRWTLELTPRDARLRKHMERIVIEGAAGELRCLTTTQPNGSASVMLLGEAAAADLPDAPSRESLRSVCAPVR